MALCADCFQPLTDEEVRYYGYWCERCESEWHDRIVAWREGGEDPEMDEMYGAPTPTRH